MITRVLFILLCSATLFSPARAAEPITIVADNWCPYNCDPASDHPGFMIEIAQKAFGKHGIAVEYSTMPWTRAIEETRNGKHTAIVGSSQKDAPDFVFPSISQGWMRNIFYVKKGNAWKYTGIDSLSQVSLGVIADYTYSDQLDAYVQQHTKNMKYIQVISGEDALNINIRKLLAGRIGALIEGKLVMGYTLAQKNLTDQIEEAGSLESSNQDHLFIAFSPKNPNAKKYADILSRETKAMRASGELKEILARYNVADWQP